MYGENQLTFTVQEDQAWQEVGMVPLPVGEGALEFHAANNASGQPYAHSIDSAAQYPHVIMSMHNAGGQHSPSTWIQEFADAIQTLYRNVPADPFRRGRHAKLAYLGYQSPPTQPDAAQAPSIAMSEENARLQAQLSAAEADLSTKFPAAGAAATTGKSVTIDVVIRFSEDSLAQE